MGLRLTLRGGQPSIRAGESGRLVRRPWGTKCLQSPQSGDGLWTDGGNDQNNICLR